MSEAKRLLNHFNEGDFDDDDMNVLKNRKKDVRKKEVEQTIDDVISIMASDPGFHTPELKMKRAKELHDWLVKKVCDNLQCNSHHYQSLMNIVKMMKRGASDTSVLPQFRLLCKRSARECIKAEQEWDDETPPNDYTPAVIEDATEHLLSYYKGELGLGNYDKL